MKNDLDLVIAALEAEKKSLQKMMKQNISEYDYLIAYHHSEALMQIDNRLRVLHSFKDPLYNQRQDLNRQEKYLRKKPKDLSAKLWTFFKERHSKEIEDRKLELEAKQKTEITFNDSQEIDDLLFAIADGNVSKFKIILTSYDDVELLFTSEANSLLISIDLYSPYEPDFVFENRSSNPLKGLGFEFDSDKQSFVYKYNLSNFKDATVIKILLSRLFFDVFNIYDVKQPMVIRYLRDEK